MAACISFCVNSVTSFLTSSLKLVFSVFPLQNQVLRVLYFFSKVGFQHKDCCRIHRRHLQSLFSPCDCTTFCRFFFFFFFFFFFKNFGISTLFFTDFVQDMLLIPLNSSKSRCIFSCLFDFSCICCTFLCVHSILSNGVSLLLQ